MHSIRSTGGAELDLDRVQTLESASHIREVLLNRTPRCGPAATIGTERSHANDLSIEEKRSDYAIHYMVTC